MGCNRSIDEIREWSSYTNAKKELIIDIAGDRKETRMSQKLMEAQLNLENSPCRNNCQIDSEYFFCKGCFLYPEEINDWHTFSDLQRQELITVSRHREAQVNTGRT